MAVFWLILVVFVLIDQATKAVARATLSDFETHSFIPGILDFKLVYNTGAAFSFAEGAGPVFVAFAIAVLIACIFVIWRHDELTMPFVMSLASISGGGFSNMLDRVLLGSVTDFLSFSFIDFPIFNLADVDVTCGVVILLILLFRAERTAPSKES